ncbi:hypothetical protein MIR68_006247 [Amoeboaphelidium protococcarum]|nr:hypothetical protein MIR68_006247 [Amoeboaphelidium protococcarum]
MEQLKKFFKSDQTFRSKAIWGRQGGKLETHGTAISINAAMSIRDQIRCPPGEDLNEWLAVNTVDFFNQTNVLYGNLINHCTDDTCPQMNAGPKYQYLWADGERVIKPLKCSAPQYVEYLMDWIQDLLDNPKIFPVHVDQPFGPRFLPTVKNIFKRLLRVYSHIYYTHFKALESIGAEKYLNASFRHFIYFAEEYALVEEKEKKPLAMLIKGIKQKEFDKSGKAVESHDAADGYQVSVISEPVTAATQLDRLSKASGGKDSTKTLSKDNLLQSYFMDVVPQSTPKTQRISNSATDSDSKSSSYRRNDTSDVRSYSTASLPPSEAASVHAAASRNNSRNGSSLAYQIDVHQDDTDNLSPQQESEQYHHAAEDRHANAQDNAAYDNHQRQQQLNANNFADSIFDIVPSPPSPIMFQQSQQPVFSVQEESQEDVQQPLESPDTLPRNAVSSPLHLLQVNQQSSDVASSPLVSPADGASNSYLPEEEDDEVSPIDVDAFRKRVNPSTSNDKTLKLMNSAPRHSMYFGTLSVNRSKDGFWSISSAGDVIDDKMQSQLDEYMPKVAVLGTSFDCELAIQSFRASGYLVDTIWGNQQKDADLYRFAESVGVQYVAKSLDEVANVSSQFSIIYVGANAFSKKSECQQWIDMLKSSTQCIVCCSPLSLPLPHRRQVLSANDVDKQDMLLRNISQHPLRYLPVMQRAHAAIVKESLCGDLQSVHLSLRTNWMSDLEDCFDPVDSLAFTKRIQSFVELTQAHMMDSLRWILGTDQVVSIYSQNATNDTSSGHWLVTFTTQNGVTGSIDLQLDYSHSPNKFCLDVYGSKGYLSVKDNNVSLESGDSQSSRILLQDNSPESSCSMPLKMFSCANLHMLRAMKLYLFQAQCPEDDSLLTPSQLQFVHELMRGSSTLSDGFQNMRVIEALRRQKLIDTRHIVNVQDLLRISPRALKMLKNDAKQGGGNQSNNTGIASRQTSLFSDGSNSKPPSRTNTPPPLRI